MAAMPQYNSARKPAPETGQRIRPDMNRNERMQGKTGMQAQKAVGQSPSMNNFSLDSDKALIIMLIAILIKSGADMPIIAALVYILI